MLLKATDQLGIVFPAPDGRGGGGDGGEGKKGGGGGRGGEGGGEVGDDVRPLFTMVEAAACIAMGHLVEINRQLLQVRTERAERTERIESSEEKEEKITPTLPSCFSPSLPNPSPLVPPHP
jgi:hypothetical protein